MKLMTIIDPELYLSTLYDLVKIKAIPSEKYIPELNEDVYNFLDIYKKLIN